MTIHRARSTDCIHSIAAHYGHSWATLWDHPKNKALRDTREAPASLHDGDEVFIPELTLKTVNLATHAVHRFRRKEVPLRLKLTLLDEDGEPRADVDYEVEVGRVKHTGKTDGDGKIDVPIPPATTSAVLRLFEPDEDGGEPRLLEEKKLVVGGLNPAGSATGAQARLRNMGLYGGPVDGEFGAYSKDALRLFQQRKGLEVTGELDDATRVALSAAHVG